MNIKTTVPISSWKNIYKAYKKKLSYGVCKNAYFESLIKEPKMRRYYPISVETSEPNPVSKFKSKDDLNIEMLLSSLGVSDINLSSNTGVVNGQTRRLGRILNSYNLTNMGEVLKKRNNTESVKSDKYYIVISAHPMDVLTSSTNRSWNSCTNIYDGCEFPYLLEDFTNPNTCGMIAYLVNGDDKEIKNPLGRVFINGMADPDSIKDFWDYRYSYKYDDLFKSQTMVKYGQSSYNNSSEYNVYSYYPEYENRTIPSINYVFNISNRSYGNFPSFFKSKLSEICLNEINTDRSLVDEKGKCLIDLQFSGIYIDGNEDFMDKGTKLNLYTCTKTKATSKKPKGYVVYPPERPKSKTLANPTPDMVIAHNVAGTNWSKEPQKRYPWSSLYIMVPKNKNSMVIHKFLNTKTINKEDMAELKRIKRLPLYLQLEFINKSGSKLLNKKYFRDEVRTWSPELNVFISNIESKMKENKKIKLRNK